MAGACGTAIGKLVLAATTRSYGIHDSREKIMDCAKQSQSSGLRLPRCCAPRNDMNGQGADHAKQSQSAGGCWLGIENPLCETKPISKGARWTLIAVQRKGYERRCGACLSEKQSQFSYASKETPYGVTASRVDGGHGPPVKWLGAMCRTKPIFGRVPCETKPILRAEVAVSLRSSQRHEQTGRPYAKQSQFERSVELEVSSRRGLSCKTTRFPGGLSCETKPVCQGPVGRERRVWFCETKPIGTGGK